MRDGGGGENGSCRRALRHRWIIVSLWNSARSRALSVESQALEALEFERDREAALRGQLEETVTELEGPNIDEETFAGMDPEDVEIVRQTLLDAGQAFEETVADDGRRRLARRVPHRR